MAELRATPAVLQELDGAIDWYAERSTAAARRFVDAVEAALSAIEENPSRFPKWGNRYRYARVRGFPYIVAFRIDGDMATVAGVRHTSRENLDLNE